MSTSKQVLALTRLCARQIRSSSTEAASGKFNRMKDLQKHLGLDNGIPVYIKGGNLDKALYGLTTGLVVLGLAGACETYYTIIIK